MSTSADIMLQLRLPLHAIFLALTHIHALVPISIPIQIPTLIPITNPILISTHVSTHITTRTHALSIILTSALLPPAPTHPHPGIPPHLSLLAGSCRQRRHRREPTFIKGPLHVVP